jgi:hypothetical protein
MFYDGNVHIEEEDQCYSCEYFLKGVMCPLLEALAVGVAHLEGDVLVKNCGFYVEFKRHLQLVDQEGEPEVEPPSAPAKGEPGEKPTRIKRFKAP